jgi:hypothetical protein
VELHSSGPYKRLSHVLPSVSPSTQLRTFKLHTHTHELSEFVKLGMAMSSEGGHLPIFALYNSQL